MTNERSFVWFTNRSSPGMSNVLMNTQGDELWIEVGGDFTSMNAEVQIQTNNGSEFYPCAVIDTKDLSVCNSLARKGVYVCSISGAQNIRIELKTISGSVDIFSRSMR